MSRKYEDYEDQEYEEEEEQPRRRRRQRRSRGFRETLGMYCGGAILLLAVVSSCLIVLSLTDLGDALGNPAENFLDVFGLDGDAEEVDTQIVVQGIQEMSVLQTATGTVTITKRVQDDRGLLPDLEMRITYTGTVDAGIDLSQITADDVVINPDNSVVVTLPPIQINRCSLYPLSSESEACVGWDCNDVRHDLEQLAFARAMEDLRNTALSGEMTTQQGEPIFDVTRRSTEDAIAHFLASFNIDRIEFRQNDEVLEPPQSCYAP
jgi:hypothetical protein